MTTEFVEARHSSSSPTLFRVLVGHGVLLGVSTLILITVVAMLFAALYLTGERHSHLGTVLAGLRMELGTLQHQALAEARYLSAKRGFAALLAGADSHHRDELRSRLRRHLHESDVDEIAVTDRRGGILVRAPQGNRSLTVSENEHYISESQRRALKGLPSMGIETNHGGTSVVATVPVYLPETDYQLVGTVSTRFHIDLRFLRRIKERIRADLSIVNLQRRALATLPLEDRDLALDADLASAYQAALHASVKDSAPIFGRVDLKAGDYLCAFTPLVSEDGRQKGIGIELLEDEAILYGRYGSFLIGLAVVMLILITGIAFASRRLAGTLTRPIGHITDAVSQLINGCYPVIRDQAVTSETLVLSRAVGALSTKLKQNRETIEADLAIQGRISATLFEEKERAQVTLESIGDGVITTDADGVVTYLNPVAAQLTGWSNHEARGRPLGDVFKIVNEKTRQPAADPVARCIEKGRIVGLANHTVLISRSGRETAIEDSAAPIRHRDGSVLGVVLVFHDVSQARSMAREMSFQASHDSLTGLVNRREFEVRLQQALDTARAERKSHVMCYIDLDQFKVVNDCFGHMAGDEMLKQLALLVQERIRDNDTLARLGGDEFGILLEGCPLDKALEITQSLQGTVRDFRFAWEGRTFDVGVSIGIVPITAESGGLSDVMRLADTACYVAKELGRNRIHVYQPDDKVLQQRHSEMQWVSRLREAMDGNRLRLHYQPILPLQNNTHIKTFGEVLLRMESDDGELIPPGAFLPAAERYQMMPNIDRWVVDAVFTKMAHASTAADESDSVISINLSGQSLSDEDFLDFVIDKLSATGIDPRRVCLEITETAAIANLTGAKRFISALRRKGCRFSLDDFGSGLSSFAYLKNLDVEYLKIDGDFVRDIASDRIDHAMVTAINQIGHEMGIETIAEFVEDDEVLAALKKLGVDYGQGYGLGHPVPYV